MWSWIGPRISPSVIAVVAIGLGLLARASFAPGSFAWKYVGVVLWCWVVHACVRFVNPRLGVLAAAAWMIGISWAVEFAQITGVPAWLSSKHIILRLVFGEVFSPWDLVAVVVAAVLVLPVDWMVRQIEQRAGRRAPDAG